MSVAPGYPSGRLTERALDLLFPPTCVGCGRVGRWICEACWASASWLPRGVCVECGRLWLKTPCAHCTGRGSALDGTAAAGYFDGTLREAVHALKYNGHHAIHGMMGRIMASVVPVDQYEVVIPVPLHPRRRRERGYDQSEMLVTSLSAIARVPHESKTLVRCRHTAQQVLLDAEQRLENVHGAFNAQREFDGERVLLVDDVTTTGSTLEAAASALKDAGAESVIGLAFASAW